MLTQPQAVLHTAHALPGITQLSVPAASQVGHFTPGMLPLSNSASLATSLRFVQGILLISLWLEALSEEGIVAEEGFKAA